MPELGFRVDPLTTGTPSHKFEHLSGGNIPEVRDEAQPPLTSGSASGSSLRAGRIARFGEALRDLGYPDPRDAPAAAIAEAGRRVDVGEKTARKYRAALLKQREAAS